ncbi:MAG: hypothetical protein PHD51_02560 [Patescibacteria group bacterium]|nr:hypothetical protein [Patescibacteria group bacterium]MDD5490260.1 hypothetical protein [Patescibacteria group bacterium]
MFKQHKKLILSLILSATIIIAGGFLIGNFVHAEDPAATIKDSSTATILRLTLGYIVELFIFLGGQLLVLLLKVLKLLAGYNDFIRAEPVQLGWVVIRDLSNMFFILILLVIAFATILRVESYQYKKLLPRLLIMAILINFSKTICGLFIDFGQVIMLTFVNGFAAATDVNLTVGLGIDKILSLPKDSSATVNALTIVAAYLLALIYIVVTVITVAIICFTLAYRIVMLWILVVLSPLTFLLSAFPQGQKFASQWWDEFSKTIVIGPILAFFLWLSLAAMQPAADNPRNSSLTRTLTTEQEEDVGETATGDTVSRAISQADDLSVFATFIVGIALMWGGIYMSQRIGGEVGSFASGKARQWSVGAARGAAGAAKWAGGKLWGGTKVGAGALDRLQGGVTGIQFSKIPERIKAGFATKKEMEEKEIAKKALAIQRRGAGAGWLPAYMAFATPDKAIMEYGGVKGRLKAANQTRRILPGLESYRQKKQEADIKRADYKKLEGENKTLTDKIEKQADLEKEQKISAENFGRFGTSTVMLDKVGDRDIIEKLEEERERLRIQAGVPGASGKDKKEFEYLDAILSTPEVKLSASEFNKYVGNKNPLAFENERSRVKKEKDKAEERLNRFIANNPGFTRGEAENTIKTNQNVIGNIKEDVRRIESEYLPNIPKHLVFDVEAKKAEAEALKNIPSTAGFPDLMRALKKALADGDASTANVISKKLSENGQMGDMLKEMGKTEDIAGFKEFVDKELLKVNKDDKNAAYSVGSEMSLYAEKSGDAVYGGIFRADPSTGKVDAVSDNEAVDIIAKRISSKDASQAVKVKISSYVKTDILGKKSLTPLGATVVSTFAPDFEKMISKGTFPPALQKALRDVKGSIEKIVGVGTLTKELADKITAVGYATGEEEIPPKAADLIAKLTGGP